MGLLHDGGMSAPDLPSTGVRDIADAVLLDVREDDEWQHGHAPGALHIPLGQLVARVGEVPQGRPVAVICRMGSRSAQATAWLLGQGLDARNVDGGMLAWQAEGLPVQTPQGTPGHVS